MISINDIDDWKWESGEISYRSGWIGMLFTGPEMVTTFDERLHDIGEAFPCTDCQFPLEQAAKRVKQWQKAAVPWNAEPVKTPSGKVWGLWRLHYLHLQVDEAVGRVSEDGMSSKGRDAVVLQNHMSDTGGTIPTSVAHETDSPKATSSKRARTDSEVEGVHKKRIRTAAELS